MSQTPPTQPPVGGPPPVGGSPVDSTQNFSAGGPPPPPGVAPPGGSGGAKKGLLIGLIVVLLAAAGAGAYFLFFSDDSDDDETAEEDGADDGRTPVDTVRGFVRAYQDRDCEAIMDHIVEEAWSRDGTTERADALAACEQGIEESAAEFDDMSVSEATLVSEEDDVAVVELVSSVADGEGVTDEVELHLEDGAWRVDPSSFQAVSGEETGEGSEEGEGEETTDTTEPGEETGTEEGSGEGSSGSGSPEEVMWAAEEARLEGDCETLLGLLSEAALEDWGPTSSEQQETCQDFVDADVPAVDDVEVVDESDTTATLELTFSDDSEPEQVNLVLEEDEWKLDIRS